MAAARPPRCSPSTGEERMSTVARHAWLDEITSPTTAKSRMMEAAQSWDVDPFCGEAANPT
eukprot:scaffold18864_cov68-Phaeocystis_antarctica.AAC.6